MGEFEFEEKETGKSASAEESQTLSDASANTVSDIAANETEIEFKDASQGTRTSTPSDEVAVNDEPTPQGKAVFTLPEDPIPTDEIAFNEAEAQQYLADAKAAAEEAQQEIEQETNSYSNHLRTEMLSAEAQQELEKAATRLELEASEPKQPYQDGSELEFEAGLNARDVNPHYIAEDLAAIGAIGEDDIPLLTEELLSQRADPVQASFSHPESQLESSSIQDPQGGIDYEEKGEQFNSLQEIIDYADQGVAKKEIHPDDRDEFIAATAEQDLGMIVTHDDLHPSEQPAAEKYDSVEYTPEPVPEPKSDIEQLADDLNNMNLKPKYEGGIDIDEDRNYLAELEADTPQSRAQAMIDAEDSPFLQSDLAELTAIQEAKDREALGGNGFDIMGAADLTAADRKQDALEANGGLSTVELEEALAAMKDGRLQEDSSAQMPSIEIDYGEALVEGINGQSASAENNPPTLTERADDELPVLEDVVEKSSSDDIGSPSAVEKYTSEEQGRSGNSR